MSAVSKQEVLEFLYAKARVRRFEKEYQWSDDDAIAEFVTFQYDVIERETPITNENEISEAITSVLRSLTTATRREVWKPYRGGRRVDFETISLYSDGKLDIIFGASETHIGPPTQVEETKCNDETKKKVARGMSIAPEETVRLLLGEVNELKQMQFELRRQMERGGRKFFTWKREDFPDTEAFDKDLLAKCLAGDLYVPIVKILAVRPGLLSYKWDAEFSHPLSHKEFVLKDLPAGLAPRDARYNYQLKTFIQENEICV